MVDLARFFRLVFGADRPRSSNAYIEMDNMILSDESSETVQDGSVRSDSVSFAIGASVNQSLFEDDEQNLVNSRHTTFSDDEDTQSPIQIRRKPVYDEDMWWKVSEVEGLGQYDDFHTIDWCRDRTRDKMRYRKVKKMKLTGTWFEKLKARTCNVYANPTLENFHTNAHHYRLENM